MQLRPGSEETRLHIHTTGPTCMYLNFFTFTGTLCKTFLKNNFQYKYGLAYVICTVLAEAEPILELLGLSQSRFLPDFQCLYSEVTDSLTL